MPTILVTNDDGVSSPGIKMLSRALKSVGDVYVVAPETEQSAVAHALTLHRPLRSEKTGKNTYSVNGTPTDCVIIAVNKILPCKPDMIVSGINNGANLGDDITYSGTVAAAIEGTLLGIPSIAVSLVRNDNNSEGYRKRISLLKTAADFTSGLAGKVLLKGLPSDTLLNVNVPNISGIKGVKFTKQGKPVYYNAVHETSDPRGRKYYWICGTAPQWEPDEDFDFEAIRNGYISITPVHLDLTNYEALKHIKKRWKI
ncbi:MAG: 5'/3'-nucleotidase SurE [Nitrospiraceae bacterium]|nr:MAG: 5'/3'-nucleotidase SurE [Nitrospiraceae bacterium]